MLKPVSGWQRAHVLAAAEYLREVVNAGGGDRKARTAYEGLLEVLEPARRAVRMQRELSATRASVPIKERRGTPDRRTGRDRRVVSLGPPGGVERRRTIRRSGRDRRG
jgi:hypothetical protein